MVCSRGWADSRSLELSAISKYLSGKGCLLVVHIVVENTTNAVRTEGHASHTAFANLGTKFWSSPLSVNHHEVGLCLSNQVGCAC